MGCRDLTKGRVNQENGPNNGCRATYPITSTVCTVLCLDLKRYQRSNLNAGFYVFLDVSLNKLLNKFSICRWVEMSWHSCSPPPPPLWILKSGEEYRVQGSDVQWKHKYKVDYHEKPNKFHLKKIMHRTLRISSYIMHWIWKEQTYSHDQEGLIQQFCKRSYVRLIRIWQKVHGE